MSERALSFRCGPDSLIGILHESPRATTKTGVLIIVGGPQYRVGSHRQFVLMARSLAERGCPVMRFDYRGMGDSDGAVRTFDAVSADIRAAVDAFFNAQPNLSGVVLWGLCDGASAALMYCGDDARVKGVIIANPWVRTAESEARTYLKHYYLQRLMQGSFWRKLLTGGFNPAKSAREISASVATASRASNETAAASPDGSYIDRMLNGLKATDAPVLVLLSDRDLTAREFSDLCARDRKWKSAIGRSRVRVVSVTDADHTFSTRAALDKATEHCATWLEQAVRASGK